VDTSGLHGRDGQFNYVRRMIGGKHIQRGTNRVLTYAAFHTEKSPQTSIFATIFEGDRPLDRPDFDLPYQRAQGSLEEVVIDCIVRYMNDTQFGEGKPPEKRHDRTDCGPWK